MREPVGRESNPHGEAKKRADEHRHAWPLHKRLWFQSWVSSHTDHPSYQ
jgi:hypothetical protein